MPRGELDRLVDRAREPKMVAFQELGERPAPAREPVDGGWFPQLVEEIEAGIEAGDGTYDEALAYARGWSSWVLGPDADPYSIERLAREHTVAQIVNLRTLALLGDCASAALEGEGLELLTSPGNGVVCGLLHTGIWATNVGLWRAMDRPVFLPFHLPEPDRVLPGGGPLVSLFQMGEDFGVRYVEPERQFGVMRRLLQEGEACALAVDILGKGDGTLLGRPVRTNRAAATLSMLTGAPIVLVGSFWDETGFKMCVSQPLEPQRYQTAREMHDSVLALMDEWLRERPEQLLVPFPAADLADLRGRRAQLREEYAREREASAGATKELKTAKRAVRKLQRASAADERIAAARRNLDSARTARKRSTLRRRELSASLSEVRSELEAPYGVASEHAPHMGGKGSAGG